MDIEEEAIRVSEYVKNLEKEIERLREALQMLVNACENGWHPMKINGAELFTARSALQQNDTKL